MNEAKKKKKKKKWKHCKDEGKNKKIKSIRRSVENSAQAPKEWDPFANGYGLLQVDKCFGHASKFADVSYRDCLFNVSKHFLFISTFFLCFI